MRTDEEVSTELAKTRSRRQEIMPTQAEPLDDNSPEPAGYWPDAPGGELTELLQREAELIIERAEIRRAEGAPRNSDDDTEEAAARRILSRLEERRRRT